MTYPSPKRNILNLLTFKIFEEFFSSSILILSVMIFINNIYGTQFLINIGKGDKFSKVLVISGLINLILCFPLTCFYGPTGTAISWIITETYVMCGMYFYATKYIKKLKIRYIVLKGSKI